MLKNFVGSKNYEIQGTKVPSDFAFINGPYDPVGAKTD